MATEAKEAARDTLDKVREFIRNNKTVYLSTHTPLGYENLDAKKIVDLDNMPQPIPPKMNYTKKAATGKYVCSICGQVYDPPLATRNLAFRQELPLRICLQAGNAHAASRARTSSAQRKQGGKSVPDEVQANDRCLGA